jgi:hypothetical protein
MAQLLAVLCRDQKQLIASSRPHLSSLRLSSRTHVPPLPFFFFFFFLCMPCVFLFFTFIIFRIVVLSLSSKSHVMQNGNMSSLQLSFLVRQHLPAISKVQSGPDV